MILKLMARIQNIVDFITNFKKAKSPQRQAEELQGEPKDKTEKLADNPTEPKNKDADICYRCGGNKKYYDGALGYEAMKCEKCGHEYAETSPEDYERNKRDWEWKNKTIESRKKLGLYSPKEEHVGKKDDGTETRSIRIGKREDNIRYYLDMFSDDGGKTYYVRIVKQTGNVDSAKIKEKDIYQKIHNSFEEAAKDYKEQRDKRLK
jgi:hypothetical protein